MGLYDCNCMITGVSLKGARAVLVPLRENGGRHSPIALGVTGTYNRLGSIDMIDEDANTAALLKFFLSRLTQGDFRVDANYLRSEGHYPFEDLEQLLGAFERTMNDDPKAALLEGQTIVFALISEKIWQSLADAAPARESALETFCSGNSVAAKIYAGAPAPQLQQHAQHLLTVEDFMRSRNLEWQPAIEPSQHYTDDMLSFLDQAKQTFHDSPVVMAGLLEYEHEVEELLREE